MPLSSVVLCMGDAFGLSNIGPSAKTIFFSADFSGVFSLSGTDDELSLVISVGFSAKSIDEPLRTLNFLSACSEMRYSSETKDWPHQALEHY